MWWVKVLVVVLLLAVVVSLFRALTALMRDQGGEGKTVRALTWRIGLSVLIFLLMLFSMYMGWVQPHDVNPHHRNGELIDSETPAPAEQASPMQP